MLSTCLRKATTGVESYLCHQQQWGLSVLVVQLVKLKSKEVRICKGAIYSWAVMIST